MLPHTKRYFRVAVSQMILNIIYWRGLILYARGIRTTSPGDCDLPRTTLWHIAALFLREEVYFETNVRVFKHVLCIVQIESCQHRVVRRGGGMAGRCLGQFIDTLFCMQTSDSVSFHNRCYIKLKSNQLGQPTVPIVLRYEQYGVLTYLLNPTPLFKDFRGRYAAEPAININ